MPGVVRTRVGYAGGGKKNPTYHDLGDHAETVQIDFDPLKIPCEELLAVFLESHNSSASPGSTQYKHALFYHDDRQQELAVRSRERLAESLHRRIHAEILPYAGFYRAEEYHQKYKLRHSPDFMAEFESIYPDPGDFADSTAAARVNGYLYGCGSFENLQAEVDNYGLSAAAREKLLGLMRKRDRRLQELAAG